MMAKPRCLVDWGIAESGRCKTRGAMIVDIEIQILRSRRPFFPDHRLDTDAGGQPCFAARKREELRRHAAERRGQIMRCTDHCSTDSRIGENAIECVSEPNAAGPERCEPHR